METTKSPTSTTSSATRGGRGGGTTSGRGRKKKTEEGGKTTSKTGKRMGRPPGSTNSTRGTKRGASKAATRGKGESRSRSRTGTAGPGRDSVALPRGSAGPGGVGGDEDNNQIGNGEVDAGNQAEEEDDEEEVEQEEEDEDENEFNIQKEREEQRKASRGLLLEAMTPEQSEKHDNYRVTTLNKTKTARFIQHVLSHPPSKPVTTIIQGVGKMFIGEMVGRAREIQRAELESKAGSSNLSAPPPPQPLQPWHILEAYREYKAERERSGTYAADGGAPGLGKRRRLF